MTSTTMSTQLARWWSGLPTEPIGARGLEQMARNPTCVRLRILGAAGVSAATAAREVYGMDV